MLIQCHITYGPTTQDGSFNPSASYTGWAFNTQTRQMQQVSGVWRGALLTTKPADVWLATGTVVHTVCPTDPADHTATHYHYQRTGETVYTTTEANSFSCGYTPPDYRTCTLLVPSVVVNYDQATVNCRDYIGPLEYSLDGGRTRQRGNVFAELAAGAYVATVYDLGATLPGCQATRPFTVADTAPAGDVATVGALPAFCFAGNPVVVQVTAAVPYHEVIVQVFVETSHRSGQFTRAYQARRRSGADRAVALDVADVLAAQLSPRLRVEQQWLHLGTAARNWFVRVADVLPQTGKPGRWTTSTNSVVVLGGLAAAPLLAGADYWGTVRAARLWHTWQPAQKKVGPRHLEVLALLVPDDVPRAVRVQPYAGAVVLPARFYAPPALPAGAPPVNEAAPPPLAAGQRVRFWQLGLDVTSFAGATQLVLDVVDPSAATGAEGGAPGAGAPALGQTRVLDVATDADPRQLVYQNSLGTFDTLAFFGKRSAKLTATPQLLEAYQPLGAGTVAVTRSRAAADTLASTTLRTAWLDTAWRACLHELVQPGREVYEYVAGQLRPVVLTTTELPTVQESEALLAAVIDYRPAHTTAYYSAF